MANSDQKSERLLSRSAVRAAWSALTQAEVHNHFLGYLHLLEAAAANKSLSALPANFKKFFERYCAAAGMTTKHPYLHPFARPPRQYKNVAGSYARSSLRDVAPLLEVAELNEDDTWTLRPNHIAVARRVMLFERPIPGLALSIFLYRDYAFSADSATSDGIQSVLRSDFGLLREADFQALLGAKFDYRDELFKES